VRSIFHSRFFFFSHLPGHLISCKEKLNRNTRRRANDVVIVLTVSRVMARFFPGAHCNSTRFQNCVENIERLRKIYMSKILYRQTTWTNVRGKSPKNYRALRLCHVGLTFVMILFLEFSLSLHVNF